MNVCVAFVLAMTKCGDSRNTRRRVETLPDTRLARLALIECDPRQIFLLIRDDTFGSCGRVCQCKYGLVLVNNYVWE